MEAGALVDQLANEEIALLREILNSTRMNATAITVTDDAVAPILTTDYPVAGAHRWLIPRTAVGGPFEVKEAETLRVCRSNANRIGGSIVNSGEKPARLFLAKPGRTNAAGLMPGIATVLLEPAGGSWDFRLGNLLWGGTVSGRGIGGATILEVAEV
jgi:hypothetical protein